MCRYINRGNLNLEKQKKKSSMRKTKDTIITTREGHDQVKKKDAINDKVNSANFKEGR